LRAVSFLQVLVQRLADRFPVRDVTFVQANKVFDELFRKYRVTFDLQVADAIKLALGDRYGDAQRFVSRRNKRNRQNGKTCTMPTEAFAGRLPVPRLQIAFRSHVVVDQVQVVVEFLAVQNVQLLDAREKARLFHVLHLTAQRAALEHLAIKTNLANANAVAFLDVKCYRARGGRNLFDIRTDLGIRMSLRREEFFDCALSRLEFDRIKNRFFRNTDAAFSKGFQDVRLRNAVQSFELN